MKAREFVLKHYPDAWPYHSFGNHGEMNAHKFTVIKGTNEIGIMVNLSDGNSESNAWVNAKKHIKERLRLVSKID